MNCIICLKGRRFVNLCEHAVCSKCVNKLQEPKCPYRINSEKDCNVKFKSFSSRSSLKKSYNSAVKIPEKTALTPFKSLKNFKMTPKLSPRRHSEPSTNKKVEMQKSESTFSLKNINTKIKKSESTALISPRRSTMV